MTMKTTYRPEKKITRTVRFKRELYFRLRGEARRQRQSVQSVMTEAVTHYLDSATGTKFLGAPERQPGFRALLDGSL